MVSRMNAGTIPDRGNYTVTLGPDGGRLGELDEEMVFETRPGENILLGASTWRVEDITRDRVIVAPAPGEPGKLPFWRGDGPGRPIELGRALGSTALLPLRLADFSVCRDALADALGTLAALDPRQSQIVELRAFGGFTVEEIAGALGVAPITVKRDWRMAKAWLRRELRAVGGAQGRPTRAER